MWLPERSSAMEWWNRVKADGQYVTAVVIGPRKCGKSSLFTRLAADPGGEVVLWDALSMARAESTAEVWSVLWKALGMEQPAAGDRPAEYLDLHFDCEPRSVTLVVDRWDETVDGHGRGPGAPDACYEVLDALARYCINQGRDRQRQGFLSLVLLTSLPDAGDLQSFATEAQRPTFERLSQTIARTFAVERFPMLSRAEAEAVLVDEGLPIETARTVAAACGGWLQLLKEAAAVVRERPGPLPPALTQVRERCLPDLLQNSVYHWLERRSEVRAQGRTAAEYLEAQLAEGAAPTRFGLPHDYARPRRVAPLIRRSLRRTFLVVDTENLYMPFTKDARANPAAYAPDGVEWHMQQQVVPWLQALREQHDIDDADVYFVGRNDRRINATVGATPGERVALRDPMREKERRHGEHNKDHSDDTLLVGRVGTIAGRYPLAHFVLVTADMDAPMVLDTWVERIWVAAPWPVSASLREMFAGTGRLSEKGLGAEAGPVWEEEA